MAILALMNPLMGVKIRLGRLDGMLEAAELASSLLQTCPGLVRWAEERRGAGGGGGGGGTHLKTSSLVWCSFVPSLDTHILH